MTNVNENHSVIHREGRRVCQPPHRDWHKENDRKGAGVPANIKEATSRDIERGTDLRQPEVSIAIKYLEDQGWIKSWKTPSDKKGRPVWNYALAVPVPEIMTSIEKQKKIEANNQLALIKKTRNYI